MPHKDHDAYRRYQNKYQKKWKKLNRKKYLLIQKKSKNKRKNRPEVKKQLREVRYRRYHRFKIKALEMYGKSCAYCGCKKYEALCVDHKNNDGNAHRKTYDYMVVNNGGMFGYCASRPFRPDLYQILCDNCNQMKSRYGILPGGQRCRPFAWWKKMSKKRSLKGRPRCTH